MIPFLLIFFVLYSSMHLYAFLKAKAAFLFGIHTAVYIALFMIIMVLAPFIVRLSERAGFEFFARLMSYIGYIWLGILFLFVSASLVIDIYHFLVYVSSLALRKDLTLFIPSARISFFIPLLLSLVITVYGYFEAKDIHTEKIIITTTKIPEEVGRLRIVQISDVHLGLIVKEDRLKRILSEVKKADPDILVSTGDLVDGQIDNLEKLAELFQDINPRYGKFAVTGNHEFYAGLDQALNFTEKAGFSVLRGEQSTFQGVINIAGVDDPRGETHGFFKRQSEKELLSELPDERFTLLLKHRPLVDKNTVGLFDLQLSGHVHRGQIFPFSIITGLYYPTQAGFTNLARNSKLYVSRGSGTWGPPVRFLSPPEVTVIDLIQENNHWNRVHYE
jgi:predicted MPP superfamily phosphohydrolase